MARIRTFIAVEIPDAIRIQARRLIAKLGSSPTSVRWVDVNNIHLTLKFLGDVEDVEIAGVCQAIASAVRDLEPFQLDCRGVGAFPDLDRPRTVWIGTQGGDDEMGVLHEAIEKALTPLGFPKEPRRFHPHLTIGRVRRPGQDWKPLSQALRAQADLNLGPLPVDEVVVFSSQLNPSGPEYAALSHAPLSGRGDR
jgi:2'-5' RNA ligase